ncbi:hypothetical protein ABFS82_07G057900 [Erythranthe guttata]
MASKYLIFPLFLAASALCYFSTSPAAQVEAGGAQAVLYFTSALPSGSAPVIFGVDGVKAQLSAGQKYQIKINANNDVHVSADYGMKFTYFESYSPGRDKGRAAVYWRIDDWGFAISYDNVHFKNVAPWETE